MSSKKYSVSLPEELAEDVRSRVGPGEFSAYVAAALEHQVAMDKLGEIVADYEKDHDPITQEEIDAVGAEFKQDEDRSSGAAA